MQRRSRHQGLKPIIQATLKAENGRLEANPAIKFARYHPNGKKLGLVLYTSHSSNGRKHTQEDLSPGLPGQKARPYERNS
jgi:hypothetical protein